MYSLMTVTIDDQPLDLGSRLRVATCVLDLEARELRTTDGRPVELRRRRSMCCYFWVSTRAGLSINGPLWTGSGRESS